MVDSFECVKMHGPTNPKVTKPIPKNKAEDVYSYFSLDVRCFRQLLDPTCPDTFSLAFSKTKAKFVSCYANAVPVSFYFP